MVRNVMTPVRDVSADRVRDGVWGISYQGVPIGKVLSCREDAHNVLRMAEKLYRHYENMDATVTSPFIPRRFAPLTFVRCRPNTGKYVKGTGFTDDATAAKAAAILNIIFRRLKGIS